MDIRWSVLPSFLFALTGVVLVLVVARSILKKPKQTPPGYVEEEHNEDGSPRDGF